MKDLAVKVWQEEITIPTYNIGKPEKNPMFFEKRVYKGCSGTVYPYPIIEKIENEKKDKIYKAVYLENEYIKVIILPELGGRVQMAYDKIKKRHFIYYNKVIKPALVGLTGPRISGGIEFNWPQYHRPSTFLPVDYTIENNADQSITVWVSENEKMFHQKAMAGFTLHPDKAYLEMKGKLYNPTPIPQTFLWWTNSAVALNKHYQSVFPPDVHAVFDHEKRDVCTFSLAGRTYSKVDYSAGVNISNYKNIPVPTSYVALNSDFDFVGGYENDTKSGMLAVSDHHIVQGKKQWTWRNDDFGKGWDRNLTDQDDPYIELMAGDFTDIQPDFSWIQPYEEKTFTQYFLPYRELGVVKNASKDLLINIEKEKDKAIIKIFATSVHKNIKIVLKGVFSQTVDLSPKKVFKKKIFVRDASITNLELSVFSENGKELLSIKSEKEKTKPVPQAVKAVLSPKEIPTCEELYLTGLHLEQYRHTAYNASEYYLEALKRDSSDIRNNNAIGLWLLRRGKFEKSEKYFQNAVTTQLQRNPNPYDGEPHYNLGLALKYQGKNKQAYDAFYKSCWNAAMQDAAHFACAQISSINNNLTDALYEIDKSLVRNWHNQKARALKAALLRRSGKEQEALEVINDSLKIDLFNFGCLFEEYLVTKKSFNLDKMHAVMRGEIHNYEITALDYIAAGMYNEAVQLLQTATKVCKTSPMTYYYMGWAMFLDNKDSTAVFKTAAKHDPEYCFPNSLEAVSALECAVKNNSLDTKAFYYLGNLWYDKRQYADAVVCWEKSAESNGTFPTVFRNLALLYFNQLNQQEKALQYMEKAFFLDMKDPRILMELDQLYKRLGKPHDDRLAFLGQHIGLVEQRDDLYLEYAILCNQTENYNRAITLIDRRIFHLWEGGEVKVRAQFQLSRVAIAKDFLKKKEYSNAIPLLKECLRYPHNLGERKLSGAQQNDIHYWLGCAYEGLRKYEKANIFWNLAKEGDTEPSPAMFCNGQKADKIFYQGLALLKLNVAKKAKMYFNSLVSFGEKHLDETIKLDYFSLSSPDLLIWKDDLPFRNKIHCHYLLGLGHYGLGNIPKAKEHLEQASKMDINHQGVQVHLAMILC